MSNYLQRIVQPKLAAYIPDDREFEETFDTFEYLISLLCWDDSRQGGEEYGGWAPLGAFAYRYWTLFGAAVRRHRPFETLIQVTLADGANAELLRAGFFGGSVDRFQSAVQEHDAWGKSVAAAQSTS